MEKIQLIFLLCFGFLSVYNFLRDREVDSRFNELETKHQGKNTYYDSILSSMVLIFMFNFNFDILPLRSYFDVKSV